MRVFSLVLILLLNAAGALASDRHALFISYNTPLVFGKHGHTDLIRFLESRGFTLHLIGDRFNRSDAIAPTPENFLETFESLADDSGVRELAVFIDLHGDPRREGQISHSVQFGKLRFSLDELIPGLERLKKRGAKVVVMDFSCYSGASLPLGRTGACIASNGSASLPTLPDYINLYAAELRADRSFEDVFLATRLKHTVLMPAISTEAGLALAQDEKLFDGAFMSTEASSEKDWEEKIIARFDWTAEEREWIRAGFKNLFAPLSDLDPLVGGLGLFIAKSSPLVRVERGYYDRTYRARSQGENDCRNFRF